MIKYPFRAGTTFTRVWEAGQSGPDVVLVHDAALRIDWWRSNIRELAESGLHVLCMDLPGHGFADKTPHADHTVARYTSFVADFIEGVGLHKPIIVGAGLGGHVAARLAVERPPLVAGLVLSAPTGIVPVGEASIAAITSTLDDTSTLGAQHRIDAMVERSGQFDDGWLEDEACINSSPGAADSFAVLSRYVQDRLDSDLVAERLNHEPTQAPIALLWGQHDRVLPVSLADEASDALGGRATIEIIGDAAHAPYAESPDQFNAAVVSFVKASL